MPVSNEASISCPVQSLERPLPRKYFNLSHAGSELEQVVKRKKEVLHPFCLPEEIRAWKKEPLAKVYRAGDRGSSKAV